MWPFKNNRDPAPRPEMGPEEVAKVVAALTRLLEPESETAKASLPALAQIWSKATASQERCEVIFKFIIEKWGIEHSDTPKALHKLGRTCLESQFAHEAERILRMALDSCQRVVEISEAMKLDVLSDLAASLGTQGKFRETEELDRRILEARQRLLGPTHFETLTSMNNLATDLIQQGKIEEAEQLYREAAELAPAALGLDHPTTTRALFNLGSLLHRQGRFPEAEQPLRTSVEVLQRAAGPTHPETLQAAQALIVVLESQSKTDETAELRRSLGIVPPQAGAPIPDAGDPKAPPGSREKALHLRSSAQRALWLLQPENTPPELQSGTGREAAHDGVMQMVGHLAQDTSRDCAGHPDIETDVRGALGQAFEALEDYARAAEQYRIGLGLCRKVAGEFDPNVNWFTGQLATTLARQEKMHEASQLWLDRVEALKRQGGATHPERLTALRSWGLVLYQAGQLSDAEAAQREEIELRSQLPGEFHAGMTAIGRELLGDTLLAQNRQDEAHALYAETLAWIQEHHPDQPAKVRLQIKAKSHWPTQIGSNLARNQMTEQKDGRQHYRSGFSSALEELAAGYPGYFYRAGPGSFVCDVHRKTGLPVCCYGDGMNERLLEWMEGFNAGVEQHIQEHGLPWNSRKEWLYLLEDILGYFASSSVDNPPIALCRDTPVKQSPDGACTLELSGAGFPPGHSGRALRIRSDHLFLGEFAGPYRDGPLTAVESTNGASPTIGAGTKLVSLSLAARAKTMELCWGPPGSHLALFRFRDCMGAVEQDTSYQILFRHGTECMAALDLELGEWLPPLEAREWDYEESSSEGSRNGGQIWDSFNPSSTG